MKYIFLFIFLVSSCLTLDAQTLGQWMKKGNEAFSEKDYQTAVYRFSQAVKLDQNNIDAQYMLGKAAFKYKSYKKSKKAFSKATSLGGTRTYSDLPLYLSELLLLEGNPKKVERTLTTWLKKNKKVSLEQIFKAEHLLRSIRQINKTTIINADYSVKHLDRPINSSFSDIAAHGSPDEFYFTSNRYLYKTKKEKNYVPSIYRFKDNLAQRWRDLKPFENINLANASFSEDQTLVVFSICENAKTDLCQLWYSTSIDQKTWSTPAAFDYNINAPNASNTQAHIRTTESGFILYFSSNRIGGQGGYDIWKAELNTDFTTKAIQCLPEFINTPLDEVTPFFLESESILFFSSNGHPSYGGFDIFQSTLENGVYSEVTFLGAPLNSKYDDVHFWLNQNDTTGFMSSNREEAAQLSGSACCYDIFAVTRKKEFKIEILDPPQVDSTPIVLIEPTPPKPIVETPLPSKPEPKPSLPKQPTRAELEQLIPLTVYFHNDEPDSNSLRVRTALTYEETYRAYSKLRDQYEQGHPAQAENIESFFINKVDYGFEQLEFFSDVLLQRLQAGDQVTIIIKGYTSPRATDAYNIALAKRRISSLRNHITTFQNGSFGLYLASRQLQIQEAPLGETTSPEGISDDYSDLQGSIYSVEASQERRVEIIRLEFNQE